MLITDSPLWLDMAEPDRLRELAADTRDLTQGRSPVPAVLEAAARRIEILEEQVARCQGDDPAH